MFTIRHISRALCAAYCLSSAAAALASDPAPAGGSTSAAPIVLARPASFAAGVTAIERATGARPVVLHGRSASVPTSEGRAFELDTSTATRLLDGSHDTFLQAGLFLFRQERSFGLADSKDVVGVLATRDWRAAVRRIGTAGAARGVTTERIITWLDDVAKREPFDITEVGVDYVAGRFRRAPKDPEALARRIAEFAPDLVRGHKEPVAGLADLVGRERVLYLIWD